MNAIATISNERRLASFLKRRWVLLACSAVFASCSFVNLNWQWWDSNGKRGVSVRNGVFVFTLFDEGYLPSGSQFYGWLGCPASGGAPEWREHWYGKELLIPIWLPLSAILGWLVIRELRWRENRSKSLDTPLE